MKKPKFEDYAIEIRPLTDEEGGGFFATFPDLPGCMADGETPGTSKLPQISVRTNLSPLHKNKGETILSRLYKNVWG